jgi:hypothetical protein
MTVDLVPSAETLPNKPLLTNNNINHHDVLQDRLVGRRSDGHNLLKLRITQRGQDRNRQQGIMPRQPGMVWLVQHVQVRQARHLVPVREQVSLPAHPRTNVLIGAASILLPHPDGLVCLW